jgi:hypothetical protein
MRSIVAHASLASFVVVSALVAACGGGPAIPATGPTPSATPSASSLNVPPSPSTTPVTTNPTAPPSKGPMHPIAPSKLVSDLKDIGLDARALPPLAKMEPEKLRKVMKTFTKALGVQCNACHDPNDFRAWTPKKKIASHMWNDWVRALAMEEKTAVLYCDSCHQGSMDFLDRGDKKALSAWMDANFVSKLKRTDAKEHGCETCHGDPFDNRFLAKWSK